MTPFAWIASIEIGSVVLAIAIVLAVDRLCTRKPKPDHEHLAGEAETDRRKTIIRYNNHNAEI